MQTALNTTQIPHIYSEFADLVGDNHWRKHAQKIQAEIKGFPFLSRHLTNENEITLQLEGLRKLQERYGIARNWPEVGQQFYSAVAFAVQVISITKSLNHKMQKSLIRRVHGALKNPDDMRGMRLELSMATHFAHRGQKIVWPEMSDEGNFDLLLPDMGGDGLEIECKSISGDRGFAVTTREALTFFQHVSKQLQPMVKALQAGVGVVVTVPDRLPTMDQDRKALAAGVVQQVIAAQSTVLPNGANISTVEFDAKRLSGLPDGMLETAVRSALDEATGTRNRHTMAIAGEAGGVIAVALQSNRDDTVLQSVFNVLGDAAKRQLTGRRAGILIAGLHGFGDEQLLSLASQDNNLNEQPTALALQVSKFLSSPARSHLVGAGFISRGAIRPVAAGVINAGGLTYHFPCPQSPKWHSDFQDMFPLT